MEFWRLAFPSWVAWRSISNIVSIWLFLRAMRYIILYASIIEEMQGLTHERTLTLIGMIYKLKTRGILLSRVQVPCERDVWCSEESNGWVQGWYDWPQVGEVRAMSRLMVGMSKDSPFCWDFCKKLVPILMTFYWDFCIGLGTVIRSHLAWYMMHSFGHYDAFFFFFLVNLD